MIKLSTYQTDKPIVAYKIASMDNVYGKEFCGVMRTKYKYVDTAKCFFPKCESIPSVNSDHFGCGFHAFKTLTEAIDFAYTESLINNRIYIPIEVELYGKIIKHTKGYRSNRQTVKKVWFPRFCLRRIVKNIEPNFEGRYNKTIEFCNKPTELVGTVMFNSNISPLCLDCGEEFAKNRSRVYSISQFSRLSGLDAEITELEGTPIDHPIQFAEF